MLRSNQNTIMHPVWSATESGGKMTLEKQTFVFSALPFMLLACLSLGHRKSSTIKSTSGIRLPGVESWFFCFLSVSLRGSYLTSVMPSIKCEERTFFSYSFSFTSFLSCPLSLSLSLPLFLLPTSHHTAFLRFLLGNLPLVSVPSMEAKEARLPLNPHPAG